MKVSLAQNFKQYKHSCDVTLTDSLSQTVKLFQGPQSVNKTFFWGGCYRFLIQAKLPGRKQIKLTLGQTLVTTAKPNVWNTLIHWSAHENSPAGRDSSVILFQRLGNVKLHIRHRGIMIVASDTKLQRNVPANLGYFRLNLTRPARNRMQCHIPCLRFLS